MEVLGFLVVATKGPSTLVAGDITPAGRHFVIRWALIVLSMGICSILTHFSPTNDPTKKCQAIGWIIYHVGMIYQRAIEPSNVPAGIVIHTVLGLWFLWFLVNL